MKLTRLFTTLAVLAVMVGTTIAQDNLSVPTRWGAHLGLNYNMSGAGYGEWIPGADRRPGGSFIEEVLNDGSGLGLYAGLSGQWHLLDWFAIQGRLSYDQRSLSVTDDQSYTNVADEFNLNIGLINLEALAKLYLGRSFHFTAGGGIAYQMTSEYTYTKVDNGTAGPESDVITVPGSNIIGSFVGGLGWDIWLSDPSEQQQWILTPFAEATWMVGMREVDFESQGGFDDGLSVITVRAGVQIAFGDAVRDDATPVAAPIGKFFRITPPEDGIFSKRSTNEYFPIRPYVFFDYNSTEIPKENNSNRRYNVITKDDRDELIALARNTIMDVEHDADVQRYMQGQVYYNILNIVGYRMQQTPTANLTLIGSDPKEKNGEALAETVKKYLVDVWEIDPSRITVTGQENPRVPSGTARTPAADRPLADIENRRVEITSNDPSIGRRAVVVSERAAREENMIDIEITTNEAIESWQVTISGNGQRKSYGPFTYKEANIDPVGLMAEGDDPATFTAEVVAKTKDGRTLSDSEPFELRLNDKNSMAERHALTFEYSDEDLVKRSEQFLSEIAKATPNGATVIISGFTDNIGSDEYNLKLSKDRAEEVKSILVSKYNAAGKKVTIRAFGYGESSDRHPYTNELPEGRMYNRTVIVDILP